MVVGDYHPAGVDALLIRRSQVMLKEMCSVDGDPHGAHDEAWNTTNFPHHLGAS